MSNTDDVRRAMVETGLPLIDLAANSGETYDNEQMRATFKVLGFAAPFVVVERKSDGKRGTLEFTHHPRVYFGFQEDTK